MLDEERTLLETGNSAYLSIGITADGRRRSSISIPWEKTVHAYNMRTPRVYLSPADLQDRDITDKIKSFRVIGCYIFTALDDYDFLAAFPELQDIYIVDAFHMKDLSFLRRLGEWHMLHIANAHLKDLEPILLSSSVRRRGLPFCLSFDRCTIDDVTALAGVRRITELIVVGEDDAGERAKWKSIPAYTHRYHTVKA